MESMGKKKPRRPRRSFTPEFKAEIVGLCRRGDRSVGQVARDFELTETAVRDWVKRTGQCWDNALAESFFSTIKRELLGTSAWPSRAAARTETFDFIEGWYKLHRLHSSLGYLSPDGYETALAA